MSPESSQYGLSDPYRFSGRRQATSPGGLVCQAIIQARGALGLSLDSRNDLLFLQDFPAPTVWLNPSRTRLNSGLIFREKQASTSPPESGMGHRISQPVEPEQQNDLPRAETNPPAGRTVSWLKSGLELEKPIGSSLRSRNTSRGK